jgi:lipoate-protein ligase A
MEQLRFIKAEYTYADFSTSISPAIELALERRKTMGSVVLNIFRGGSFTVGFLDDPEKSLDLDYCKKSEIVVRRRQNTGGAIWGPDGGAFMVICVDTTLPWVPMKGIKDAFRVTLTQLAEAVKELFNINAVYRPLNDIEVEGRKLIPSSARLEKGILTVRLLINVLPTNQDLLKKAIRTPIEKMEDKKIKDVAARFTWLEKEAGRKTDPSELEALTRRTIEKKKYTSAPWFYENSERMRFKEIPPDALKTEGRHKAPAGLIRVTLLVRRDEIHDLIITGDFHPTPYRVLKDMEDALRGRGCDIEIVEEEIQRIFSRPDVEIAGTEVRDFVSAFRKAFDQAG